MLIDYDIQQTKDIHGGSELHPLKLWYCAEFSEPSRIISIALLYRSSLPTIFLLGQPSVGIGLGFKRSLGEVTVMDTI